MQRLMERSNSMARGKRALNPASAEADGQPDRKRPALASVIVEALKVDSLQKLCSSLEPILRRVVSEEVERALVRLGSGKLAAGRVSPKQIGAPDGRNLQLQFRTQLSLPLFTGGKVEGEQGSAIHVVLVDANTGQVVTSGPESCVKLDIAVLEGDFNHEDDENWSQEDFEKNVVKERDGKRPLLTGDVQFSLKEGMGTLGELTFTDNSSWIRSRKFRLGIKVASGHSAGFRIREGKTEAFTVKDHRGELYKKHYPPALTDEVWRLEKIGKDGSFHKRLNKAGILTVEHFLRFVVRDPQRLRHILGTGMSNKMWETVIEHAKTCVLGGKFYIYYPDDGQGIAVVFNDIYEFSGLIVGGQYLTSESFSESQKVYADTLVKKAYDNWTHVLEYDSESLLSLKPDKNDSGPQIEATSQQNVSSNHQQLSPPILHAAVPLDQPSMDSNLKIGGYNDTVATCFTIQPQNTNPNGTIQYSAPSHQSSSHSENSRGSQAMPIAPSNSSLAGFQPVTPLNDTSFEGIADFISEHDIRVRSQEMLEHEDMQYLLRIFNTGSHGGQTSANMTNVYPYSSAFVPSPSLNDGFDEETVQTSGKAVVGWLKLKAALRWGIFVRKRAAERRAQLVELDDT